MTSHAQVFGVTDVRFAGVANGTAFTLPNCRKLRHGEWPAQLRTKFAMFRCLVINYNYNYFLFLLNWSTLPELVQIRLVLNLTLWELLHQGFLEAGCRVHFIVSETLLLNTEVDVIFVGTDFLSSLYCYLTCSNFLWSKK